MSAFVVCVTISLQTGGGIGSDAIGWIDQHQIQFEALGRVTFPSV